MREPILVINAGSSSVKFSIFATRNDRSVVAGPHGQVEEITTAPRFAVTDTDGQRTEEPAPAKGHDGAIAAIHRWCVDHLGGEAALAGVGHRVVHGGASYADPVLIDEAVLRGLEALVPLAPLHQPHNIAAIRAVGAAAPALRQVACFDTAFHRTLPDHDRNFALPRAFFDRGIRRYGFHGLSYEYIVSTLPRVAAECVGRKLVIAHLGNGASLCAVDQGCSVATTMGLTPLDGVPMGTRTGAIDPGVILYLLQHDGMTAGALETLLYEQSGLLGVSGLSSDMRTLLASDQPAARQAIDLFVYRVGREIGSLAAALGGLDALIFTAGIGEHAPAIRAGICRDAGWLGLAFDSDANDAGGPRISRPASAVSAWVIPTDENLVIASHTRQLLDRIARAPNPT